MRSRRRRSRRGGLRELILLAAVAVALIAIEGLIPEPDPVNPSGRAQVVDGDSLRVAGTKVRLNGIDAPELGQTCRRDGKTWACGAEAARRLRRRIDSVPVSCTGNRFDRHDRLLAVCTAGAVELNRWLVEQGWALSYHDYPQAESAARQARRGLWSSSFEHPRDWRARHGSAL